MLPEWLSFRHSLPTKELICCTKSSPRRRQSHIWQIRICCRSRKSKDALMAAAGALGRQLIVVECRSDDQLQMSFHAIVERAAGGLIVAAVPLFSARNIDKIVAFAAQHKIPAIYP